MTIVLVTFFKLRSDLLWVVMSVVLSVEKMVCGKGVIAFASDPTITGAYVSALAVLVSKHYKIC